MDTNAPLPAPDSPELAALGVSGVHKRIYEFLHARQDFPPTMEELRAHIYASTGKNDEQLDRRKRDLNRIFFIEVRRWPDGKHRHQLMGWAEYVNPNSHLINSKLRYQVLQSGKCRKCGRLAEDDGVRLVVDHIVPQNWGGNAELANLQPLCDTCNQGKKDYYADFDRYAEEIRQAIRFDEPHRRIAMLLKALQGRWVSSELIGAIASAQQYQDDWHKRLRELRELGIDYEYRKTKQPSGRVTTEWKLTKWVALPNEPLAPLIRKLERERHTRPELASN